MENVIELKHPLIQHKISKLRDKHTGTNEFRKLVEEKMFKRFIVLAGGKTPGQVETIFDERGSVLFANKLPA